MRFATLKIDKFGARSNLQLNDLSNQLNVIYGPNGSGKTTIFSFIRWLLYGNTDGSHSKYLQEKSPRASGTLTVTTDHVNRKTVSRTDDGSPLGSFRLENSNGDSNPQLTGVDGDEFRHIFSISFEYLPAIERLIQTAAARGFDVTFDEEQIRRLRDLETRLAQQRSESTHYPHPETHQRLAERRESIQREIESLEIQKRQRLAEIEISRREIVSELSQRKTNLQTTQSWLNQLDSMIQDRRNQLDAVARDAENARQAWIASRKKKVEEIDRQMEHWRQVLTTIRARSNKLKTRLAKLESTVDLSLVDDDSDVRYFMSNLVYRVDDIEQDLIRPFHEYQQQEPFSEHDYVRSVYDTAFSTMRDDITRLADKLRTFKASSQQNEYGAEINQLHRLEAELNDLVDTLLKRRDALMSQPETRRDFHPSSTCDGVSNGPSYAAFPERPNHGTSLVQPWYQTMHPWYPTNGATKKPADAMFPATGNTAWTRAVDPVLETRLQHLLVRRHQVAPQVEQLERQVQGLESRLGYLDQGPCTEDKRIQGLRQELVRIDEQCRLADAYQTRLRDIALTEEEIQRLRTSLSPSSLLQEASAILNRLTDGRLVTMNVNRSFEISLKDNTGRQLGYGELSRGGCDQCYLALCLALVLAYQRRGVHHPLILSDVFDNIDSDRTSATLNVLQDIARSGQQVVLFTRHDHIMSMFSDQHAKVFSLQPRVPRTDYVSPSLTTDVPRNVYLPPIPESASEPSDSELIPETSYQWVTRWEKPDNSPNTATSNRQDLVSREDERDRIGLESPLRDVSTLDSQFVSWFHEIGVKDVSQFLQLDANETARQLRKYQVVASQVYRWQSEILLQVNVGVSGIDSQILVDCGIDDPEELAACNPEELYRRISNYLTDAQTRRRFPTPPRFDRKQVEACVERAQRSNYRRRNHRQEDLRSRPLPDAASRKSRVAEKEEVKNRASQRKSDRKSRSLRRNAARPAKTKKARDPGNQESEFHLQLTDPLVHAPSIGPRTAERFEAIGVHTITELLDIDPETAAEKIAYPRISPEIVTEWQLQSKLVYQIPNLTAHNAQILVASNVSSPNDLARADASTLFKEVKRFCNTTEGKRILRNGKKPDIKEVGAWIEWAGNARELAIS